MKQVHVIHSATFVRKDKPQMHLVQTHRRTQRQLLSKAPRYNIQILAKSRQDLQQPLIAILGAIKTERRQNGTQI